MGYDVPGRADVLDPALVEAWNETIQRNLEAALADLGDEFPATCFFVADPGDLDDPTTTDVVHWPGDPLEPTFCVDPETVRALCDWAPKGRHELQNEYCEYAVVRRAGADGQPRPKRVQITTELAEYWGCLATHDPDRLRTLAAEILGHEPEWNELYRVPDPHALGDDERRVGFARTLAGHGGHKDLVDANVPRDPEGRLNTQNALFMTNVINGLDDLLFIVLFGARRFAVQQADGSFRRANRNDIFATRKKLNCRQADPAAALTAYDVVHDGRQLAFANPLGMYIRENLNRDLLRHAGEAIPEEWVRWSRGKAGMRQRLELGPGDEDDAFLDDIVVEVGQEPEPLTGGYQLIQLLEVGPLIATGATPAAGEHEFTVLPAGAPIECRETGICKKVNDLKGEHDRAVRAEAGRPVAPEE